ncbi:zinc ribbon domain-containing protein [Streptomyces sp. NBC_00424]|uniref:NADase-type glycan-binding domain-containing protein n=1 Tax=Streptomyces sp. NBC_00424 TaxID=2903648 RepID=UPI00225AE174|nr:zinc ribbon domain-containing protein [Streptomyces sp. NBC_00424]MCX5078048.1 zinc ribbon domain-containing protein [Streptomyces sp. NBC_00424]
MTTQNCAECGTRAEPGQSFCDACGAVLSWDQGSRAARPAGPSSHPRGPAADAARTPHEASRTAGGSDSGTPEHAGTPDHARTATGTMDAARAERAARAAGRGTGPATASAGGSRGPASAPAEPDTRVTAGSPDVTRTPENAGGTGQSGATAAPGTAAASAATEAPGDPDRPDPDGPGAPGHAEPVRRAGESDRSGPPARTGGSGGAEASGPATGGGGRPIGPGPAHPDRPGTPSAEDTAATAPTPHALSDTMSDRARSLLVPVADPEAPHDAPAAVAPVLPGRPDAERPAVRAPGAQPGIVGGPPCRWCSTPNRPDRHYCVRCAMPLAETADATATGRAPWWRRLFAGRRRETPWAGDRPRLRRVFDRIGTWITLAVVVTLAILGLVYLPDGVQATRDHFAKRAPVAPDRVTASRSYPEHKPELAFDKRSNTWWGPGVSQSGQGEWIEAGFSEPTRLLDVIITPGVSAKADKIGESALPHRVTATITGKDGKVTTRRLTLDQGAGGQRRAFRVGEVTKVRFTIETSHAVSADKQVAITEIEFFGPSSANR